MRFIKDHYASERGLIRLILAHVESWLGRTREFENVDLARVNRLVFVCLGNICRSPFAEVVAKQKGLNTAGFGLATTTGLPAFELGITTANKFGISMDAHRTTALSDFEIKDDDLMLVMEVRHARRLAGLLPQGSKAQIALLGQWAKPRRLHIHDPHVHDEMYFANCYHVILNATTRLVDEYKIIHGINA